MLLCLVRLFSRLSEMIWSNSGQIWMANLDDQYTLDDQLWNPPLKTSFWMAICYPVEVKTFPFGLQCRHHKVKRKRSGQILWVTKLSEDALMLRLFQRSKANDGLKLARKLSGSFDVFSKQLSVASEAAVDLHPPQDHDSHSSFRFEPVCWSKSSSMCCHHLVWTDYQTGMNGISNNSSVWM